MASRNLGKAAVWLDGNQPEAPNQDSWQLGLDSLAKMQQDIKPKDATIRTMGGDMRRMQNELGELKRTIAVQPIPIRQDISTPPSPRRDITKTRVPIIMAGIICKRQLITPNTITSSDSSDINSSTKGLFRVIGGNGGGGDGDDGDLNGNGIIGDDNAGEHNYGYNTRRGEFILVKASNITATTFTGSNRIANPYLQFYKSMRRLIHSQDEDGEMLLKLLDEIENKWFTVFIHEQVKDEIGQCPIVAQFNRAILTALLNYTAGIVRGMIEYGIENGLDAWRKLYHRYMPLADDLQQLLIQEFYALTFVTESTIDTLFNKVERITEPYTRHGAAEDQISDEWIKAAVMRNLPKQITYDLVIQLKDVRTTGEVRHIINIYMHGYQTGMPRGQAGPMLCIALQEEQHNSKEADEKTQDNEDTKDHGKDASKEAELYAASKGKGKGKKGAKGFGECWHCGAWGHPPRESPRLNEFAKGKGSFDALKGGKGKGKRGKGGKGKGKTNWGNGYGYQYRSPGKGVGKGLNQVDSEWYNAWGAEGNGEYD